MKNKVSTIWSNEIDMKDWEDYIKEQNAERAEEGKEPLTDDEAYEEVRWLNDECYLDDARINLDAEVSNSIVVLADLGLWYGRRQGFKVMSSRNLKEVLYSDCDYCTWYCDRYDFKFRGVHHDGTNHYTYREMKDDKYIDFLHYLAYEGKLTQAHITRYTRSLRPKLNEIFGF